MNFQRALVAGGVVGRTMGKPGSLVLSRRSKTRACEKEIDKAETAFRKRFGEKPTPEQMDEVAAAYAKIYRKWGVWGPTP